MLLLLLLLFISLLCSRTGREKTWEFIKKNIGELKKRLGGAFLLSRVLEMSTSSFASEDVAKEVEVRVCVCVVCVLCCVCMLCVCCVVCVLCYVCMLCCVCVCVVCVCA